ncbi:MAG: DsbA family protein [Alphaproteobacteria bacterium]
MPISKNLFLSVAASAMLGAAAVLTGPAGAQTADAAPISTDQKKAFESIVRDYILENPEIITQAIERLREKQRLAEARADQEILASSQAEIFNDPDAPVGGNPKGDVTVVEFFDYRCGVCKRIHPIVNELVKTDPNIRRVYKEWPILGPNSVLAARAAIASRKQGKYLAFHKVIMEANSAFDQASILQMAKAVGMDTAQLLKDMKSAEVDAVLRKNYALADKLKLNGTPSFVIGDTLLRGGRDLASLRAIVAEARAAKK